MRVGSESMIAMSLSMLLMLSASILTIPKAAADDYVDTASVSISASCSMSGTGLVHSAEVNNGQTVNDIGLTNIKVFCNDRLGFAVYAIGYTDDTYGKTVLSNSTLGSSFDIETSATIVDATSSWAMKLAAVSGTYAPIIAGSSADTEQGGPDFSNYAAIPEEYTKVAYYGSNTDAGTSAAGSNISVTYRAHVSRFQPAGTYVGQVKYTLVHPNTANAPLPVFIMQDVANWKNKLGIGDEAQARDARDNKVYYVAKLADGNIWMTQNLDHDIGDITGGTYTSADTDLPANSSWTPDESEYEYTRETSDTDWNWSYTEPESYDPGDLCWTENLNTNWNGTLTTETESCTQNGNHYHIGNYYNWTAAVAMSDSSSYEDDGDDVNQSICPAGWMLPKSGNTLTGSGSFINLVTEYDWDSSSYMFTGSYTAWDEPLRLALGGYWYGDSGYVASDGEFWSSVVNYDVYAYLLVIDAGDGNGGNPQDVANRSYGYSVRCVAR